MLLPKVLEETQVEELCIIYVHGKRQSINCPYHAHSYSTYACLASDDYCTRRHNAYNELILSLSTSVLNSMD